tara:strand:- start:96 stop:668 length:573 start_codon:yes stop_codon:yes gene_type:complete
MFQTMIINIDRFYHHNPNPVKFVQMTDKPDEDKAFKEWYKTYTTTEFPSSKHGDLYEKNTVVTVDDWYEVCFAIRFAEFEANNRVTAMTYSRFEEETKLVMALDNAHATEAILIMANAIDDAWISNAHDLVKLARERVDSARASEEKALAIYHTAVEKTNAIEIMEESRIAETMYWAYRVTNMQNKDKHW